MGKYYFTKEQIDILKTNKYVKNISEKAITYTEDFKIEFSKRYNSGELAVDILLDMGLDPKILGEKRIYSLCARLKRDSNREDRFRDTRVINSGRSLKRNLSKNEIIEKLKIELEIAQAKIEFLSDLRKLESEVMEEKSNSKKKKSSK